MSRNILITGSGGYLGSVLYNKLNKQYNVFHYDILYGQDILNKEQLEKEFIENKIDYVVHLAAVANLNFYDDDIGKSDDINITGSKNLLELCDRYNAKLLFASTCCCYGDNKLNCSDETSKLCPTEAYAKSKKTIEDYMLSYDNKHVIMRLATFYGGQNVRKEIVIPLFIDKIYKEELIEIHGNGFQKRTYTHVEDISTGIKCLINNYDNLKHKIYNITTENSCSLYDILFTISKFLNKEFKVKYVKDRDSQFTELKISNKRLRGLGWNCKYDLYNGMKESIESYEKNGYKFL